MHQAADREGLFEHRPQLVSIQGLGQVVIGPAFHRLDRGFRGAMARDEDDQGFRIEPSQFVEQLQARLPAEANVQQDHIRRLFGGQTQAFVGGLSPQHGDVLLVDNCFDSQADTRLVINDEQSAHRGPPSGRRKCDRERRGCLRRPRLGVHRPVEEARNTAATPR